MTARRSLFPASLAFLLLLPAGLQAQDAAPAEMSMDDAATVIVKSADVEYAPIEVPGFDTGMQIAVLTGDPSGEGPYVLRLSFPDGYRFPAHWHPMAENLTVLEGTLLLGMGSTVDESEIVKYQPGDFLSIPAENPHFGGAEGATQIQLHGMGPFQIILVE